MLENIDGKACDNDKSNHDYINDDFDRSRDKI